MIETNPSSNAATVSLYLLRSCIVSNVRDSLVYIFGGLKTMLLCIEFSPFHDHSAVRLSVRMYVINCCVTLRVKLSHLFRFSRKLNGTRFLYLVLPPGYCC